MSPASSSRRLALAAVLAAVLGACAATPRAEHTPGEDTRRQEILVLYGKILDWRREAGLGPAPASRTFDLFYAQPSRPVADSDDAVVEICRDVCSLADYICQAADDVCRIAGELDDDDWARRKCASAKASCVESRDRCSGCTRRAATPAGP